MPDPIFYSPIGLPFTELESVDSTNNYALAQAHAGLAQHGAVYFTHEQLAGKGQRGRNWSADRGRNILMSVMLDPRELPFDRQFCLSAAVAVSVADFFTKYTLNDTRIKWPNDLYWQDRKAGGILIENLVRSVWRWSVVGIGININQESFLETLRNPVSLKQITGKELDPVQLAKELCGYLEKTFKDLISNGFDDILKTYNEYLYKRGEMIRLKRENVQFTAHLVGVAENGSLLVERRGTEEAYDFGQVEWVIPV